MSSILFYSTRMRKKLEKNGPVSRIVPKYVKGDLKKASITYISSASRSKVAFSVSSSQRIKLKNSVLTFVLKKESHCNSLRFLQKAPPKMGDRQF